MEVRPARCILVSCVQSGLLQQQFDGVDMSVLGCQMQCRVSVVVGTRHVDVAYERFQHFRSTVTRSQLEVRVSVELRRNRSHHTRPPPVRCYSLVS